MSVMGQDCVSMPSLKGLIMFLTARVVMQVCATVYVSLFCFFDVICVQNLPRFD